MSLSLIMIKKKRLNVFRLKSSKVRIFWEGHKIWKNLPLKIWRYSVTSNFRWKIFSNLVAFSEYPNFNLLVLHNCNNDFYIFVFQPFVCQSLFGLALVLSNILMLQNFNKALQASRTTLEASIINTASNFVFTVSIVTKTTTRVYSLACTILFRI